MKNKLINKHICRLTLTGILLLQFSPAIDDRPSVQAMNNYERQYTVLMNNVVNANTPGFRACKVITRQDANGNLISEVIPVLKRRGGLVFSGDPLHIGIDGPGFYMVKGPSGMLYTRDGRFKVDSNSQLVTVSGGFPLYGDAGIITLPSGENTIKQITVSDTGVIVQKGNIIDRLVVGDISDFSKLEVINGNFFKPAEGAGELFSPLPNFTVRQHYYEASNVEMSEELINMPSISKKFDANSKALQMLKKITTTGREMGSTQ